MQAAVGVKERFLSRIRGIGTVAGQHASVCEGAGLIASDEVSKRVPIAAEALTDRIPILHVCNLLPAGKGPSIQRGLKRHAGP